MFELIHRCITVQCRKHTIATTAPQRCNYFMMLITILISTSFMISPHLTDYFFFTRHQTTWNQMLISTFVSIIKKKKKLLTFPHIFLIKTTGNIRNFQTLFWVHHFFFLLLKLLMSSSTRYPKPSFDIQHRPTTDQNYQCTISVFS